MSIQRIRELKAQKRKLEEQNRVRKEAILNREKLEAKRELLREKQAAREERQTERRNKRVEEEERLAQERMTRHRSIEAVSTLMCGEILENTDQFHPTKSDFVISTNENGVKGEGGAVLHNAEEELASSDSTYHEDGDVIPTGGSDERFLGASTSSRLTAAGALWVPDRRTTFGWPIDHSSTSRRQNWFGLLATGANFEVKTSITHARLVENIGRQLLFASALDGWGFGIQSLSRCLYQQKLPTIKPKVLRQYLFGDYRYNADTQKVLKRVPWNSDSLHMFAEFALKPIWDLYQGVEDVFGNVKVNAGKSLSMATPGMEELVNVVRTTVRTNHYDQSCRTTTSITTSQYSARLLPQTSTKLLWFLNEHGSDSGSSAEEATRALIRRYRPLNYAVLDAIVEVCPRPRDANHNIRTNVLSLSPSSHGETPTEDGEAALERLQRAVQHCSTTSPPPNMEVPAPTEAPPSELHADFAAVFEELDPISVISDASIQHQTTLPPYCDEEGLGNAKAGRCRVVLQGRVCTLTANDPDVDASFTEDEEKTFRNTAYLQLVDARVWWEHALGGGKCDAAAHIWRRRGSKNSRIDHSKFCDMFVCVRVIVCVMYLYIIFIDFFVFFLNVSKYLFYLFFKFHFPIFFLLLHTGMNSYYFLNKPR